MKKSNEPAIIPNKEDLDLPKEPLFADDPFFDITFKQKKEEEDEKR